VFTERQYEFFRSLYEEENERYTALEARTKLYLTVITLYVGAIAFKFEDVAKFATRFGIATSLLAAVGLIFLLALVLTVLAARIRDFEGLCEPEALIEGMGNKPITDSKFFEDRVIDLAVATTRNSKENDKIAGLLYWASVLIALGVLAHFLIVWAVLAFAS
jgi:hypothetical protein